MTTIEKEYIKTLIDQTKKELMLYIKAKEKLDSDEPVWGAPLSSLLTEARETMKYRVAIFQHLRKMATYRAKRAANKAAAAAESSDIDIDLDL